MNHDEIINFCTAAEALLAEHAADDTIRGFARPLAQCTFARHASPLLHRAVEWIRELVGENAALRIGVNESESVLLRMWMETQVEKEQLRETMPCGHPRACVVNADDGTECCAWCADRKRWELLIEVAAENVDGFRDMFIEREATLSQLKEEAKLNATMLARQSDLAREAETTLARERMRATVGGGSVL